MPEYTVIDKVLAWQLEIGDWVLIGEVPAKITGVVDDDSWMMSFNVSDEDDNEDVVHFTPDRTVEVLGWI